MPEPDRHDRELDAWVLAAVAELDVDGLKLGLGARELPVPGVAERAGLDERVVGVVADRLAQRGLVRLLDHADPARVVLTPAGRRAAADTPKPARAPAPDGSRFVFLRPAAPQGPAAPDDEQVCDFHPKRRRKGVLDDGGEHCDGSGWIVDPATRESRPCRCRPLRIARNRDRRLGGRITTEILNYGLASSLHPELHPALVPVVARWTADVDAQLDAGRGLWMTVAGWDRRVAADALDEDARPPRTQAEFEAAAARAGRLLDADALTDQRHREQASRAGGELSLMEVRKVAETAAGSSAAAIARAAHHAGRGVALYSLSSLYRSLVHLSRHGGYRERLDALRTADLVVLVGLDHQVLRRAAPWQRDWLSEQLELIAIGRYEHLKSTVIVSTGWPLEHLQEALSPETFHRLACAAGEPLPARRPPAATPSPAATVT
ncbi:MAG TPA: hypothetical protein VFG42_22555 [Baekduia sp.]|uniref:hypothetical protein n=1 Tax=Baekduia sp. TaxID=2600305 RepID=UPI002D78C33A|nr:hypothetical protein [Baekduia sp.]HET6509596.1 hypothetical protein [Baekduia sp.]